MDVELLPETQEQARIAVLAFSGIVGGGLIAYEVGRALREGNLLKTDPVPPNPQVGAVAWLGGSAMLAMAIREASKDIGWKPLALGSVAVFGVALLGRAIRR